MKMKDLIDIHYVYFLYELEDFLDHQVRATFGTLQREKLVNATVNLWCVISQLVLCVIDVNDDDDDDMMEPKT